MSEVNVRKWHEINISSHVSSKLAQAKIKIIHVLIRLCTWIFLNSL